MKLRVAKPAIYIGLLFLALAALFLATAPAKAGFGEEENTGGLLQASSPLGGSLDLLNCDDGAIAVWRRSALTFRIDNKAAADQRAVEQVRAGVLEWNRVRGPYKLSEVTNGRADITVRIVDRLGSPTVIGTTFGDCSTGAKGITSATISVLLKGLSPIGVQNLTAHETGHALGLGHSDHSGDLMDPNYQTLLDGTLPICPSNMDVAGLTAKKDPYRMLPVLWLMVPIC